jgi:pimeloyl-ACP methyl ester carboxylesterase
MSAPRHHDVTVESADGTPLIVQVSGHGTLPLVIVGGSLSTADDWRAVADDLGDVATVYVMNRRGRGGSGAGGAHSIEREYEDVAAVRALAGPGAAVFAHSYGAVVALGQALIDAPPALAIYEPPLPIDGPIAGERLETYETAVREGRLDDALVFGMVQFVGFPAELIEPMRAVLPWDHLVSLTPTWVPELHAIDALEPGVARFAALDIPVLEIVGELSPPALVAASEALAQALPRVRVERLAGQGHVANAAAPVELARLIRDFITE